MADLMESMNVATFPAANANPCMKRANMQIPNVLKKDICRIRRIDYELGERNVEKLHTLEWVKMATVLLSKSSLCSKRNP